MRIRFLLIIGVLLAATVTLFLLLLATDTALSVWRQLRLAPLWAQVAYTLVLISLSGLTLWLTWRWLKPAGAKPETESPELDPDTFRESLTESAAAGVDVSGAIEEIREQRRRKQSGEIFIAIFGEVSAGKSSLVKALLPGADTVSDPRGGTTRQVGHFRWKAASGDVVDIADLPGFNLDDNPEIMEEARRAHLVVYLCDNDLTRSQAKQLHDLQSLNKPLIVALNKLDRFSPAETRAIATSIASTSGIRREDIVCIQTGGREEVVRLLSDGRETSTTVERERDVESLRAALQREIDNNRQLMDELRDSAVLMLAAEKLAQAQDRHREERAAETVHRYARRAVVGALAAVAPGTDLLIQGVLATRLIKELSEIYGVSVREVEIESFLKLAGGKIRKMTAIVLAITGNALKAFPGIGTLTGGLVHAVAYGMIFDSLGRAAAQTLASRGELRPYPAAKAFEELLNDNLETGAVRFAKLAVGEKKERDGA